VNNEQEGIWKKAAVASCKVPSRHLLGGTEKTTKSLSQSSRSPGRDYNPGPPEYEPGVPTGRPQLLISFFEIVFNKIQ
jgi:hypothetical protein